MFGTLYSFQSISTNTISIGLIWSPQGPEKYPGSQYCVSGCVRCACYYYFHCAQRNLRLGGVWWVTVTTGICQTCQTKRKLLAKPSNRKLLVSYYTWKLMLLLVYVLAKKSKHALGSTRHLGAPAPSPPPPPLCMAPVPSSVTDQPLFPFSAPSQGAKKEPSLLFHPKSQSRWIMSFKRVWALKLCYNLTEEVLMLVTHIGQRPSGGQSWCWITDAIMFPDSN